MIRRLETRVSSSKAETCYRGSPLATSSAASLHSAPMLPATSASEIESCISGSVSDTNPRSPVCKQYALADVGSTICKVPDGLSDDDAATIPTNITSVFVALFIMLGIKAPWEKEGEVPDHLLIVGGGSNCGRFAVQLARLAGIKTIITIGGNESELETMGATHVLNRHADEAQIVQQVKSITNDELIYAFDTVNQPDGLAPGFSALSSRKKGALARLIPRGVIGDDVKKGHQLWTSWPLVRREIRVPWLCGVGFRGGYRRVISILWAIGLLAS